MKRLYNGKNRTTYVKDAFHDHIIPSHRPKEPEPERTTRNGLPMKKSSATSPVATKSPGLPPDYSLPDEDEDEASPTSPTDSMHSNHTVPPPPRPVNPHGARQFVNPDKTGTKAGAHYVFNNVPGNGGCVVVRLKMTPATPDEDSSILDEELFDDTIEDRRVDADEFYARIARGSINEDLRNIMRQALSGMLW